MKLIGRGKRGIMSMSRPARGAWIETNLTPRDAYYIDVAPRTGRVD